MRWAQLRHEMINGLRLPPPWAVQLHRRPRWRVATHDVTGRLHWGPL